MTAAEYFYHPDKQIVGTSETLNGVCVFIFYINSVGGTA